MRNSIIEIYLKQCSKPRAFKQKRLVKDFKAALVKVNTFKELHSLLSQYIDKELEEKSGEDCAFFGATDFFHTLKEWKETLDAEHQRALIIHNKLIEFNPPKDSSALVAFILSLLDDPKSLLHQRTSSLLTYLNLPHLEKTLSYLDSLAEAPWPQNLRQGDYLAIKPVTADHAKCLKHLNNNCAVFNVHNIHCDHANSILQAVLMIFEDLELDSLLSLDPINDELESDDELSTSACCCWPF
ncbi:hypothetical protein BN59_02264 [Legionella massiliensis]|uniref:Uncharacterized protein n=1 Tax=Legionella massiliensis TaxID=1034943 RepID=A0A078L1S5_9GAMM|nr:hypothetical protein [Legionella massiliensis]CDZ77968.1 hypothetical protein BN59_02264 [Legionella massiliensis]CEE13706.1 hypothetical protein BN1094_02264 [Legionella massiliensis]